MSGERRAEDLCEAVMFRVGPWPLVSLRWSGDWRDRGLHGVVRDLVLKVENERGRKPFCRALRCVDASRLRVILATGCDVEPSNSVIWVDPSPDKVLEYGTIAGSIPDYRVVQVFDQDHLQPTYREISADTPAEEIAALRQTYPSVERSVDGRHLWLSRLPEADRRITTPYEREHGRWIPGDARDALVGLIVVGRELLTRGGADSASRSAGGASEARNAGPLTES